MKELSLREMMVEMILFAFDEDALLEQFQITEDEVSTLSDVDLLEMYDQTLITMGEQDENS